MNRKNLNILIAVNMLVFTAALGLMANRYFILSGRGFSADGTPAPGLRQTTVTTEKSGSESVTGPAEPREIVFTYRADPNALVEIAGDFNNWIPEPMNQTGPGLWTSSFTVTPGEYIYNFFVDGTPVTDPSNPVVCDVGRGFVNSCLRVEPPNDDR